jgi:hypothetical protein
MTFNRPNSNEPSMKMKKIGATMANSTAAAPVRFDRRLVIRRLFIAISCLAES